MSKTLKYYKPDEVAEILGVTRRTVYSYIKGGELKCIKLGNRLRISQEALEAFLETKEGGA